MLSSAASASLPSAVDGSSFSGGLKDAVQSEINCERTAVETDNGSSTADPGSKIHVVTNLRKGV